MKGESGNQNEINSVVKLDNQFYKNKFLYIFACNQKLYLF